MEKLAQHLVAWIRAEVAASGGEGVVYGLSGGVDSAVVAALAAEALPGRSLGVFLPCHSDEGDAHDVALVARALELSPLTIDLGSVYDLLLTSLSAHDPAVATSRIATTNLKPRLRMTALYAFANERNYRVLGCSNRSERAIGYFTKYGDGGADLLPLGSLVKQEVRALARTLGVPPHIVEKPPSAGLYAGQTDEAEMGLTYEELDAYLLHGVAEPAVREHLDALYATSEHKRTLPAVAPKPGA